VYCTNEEDPALLKKTRNILAVLSICAVAAVLSLMKMTEYKLVVVGGKEFILFSFLSTFATV
jgi:hypothetical protein